MKKIYLLGLIALGYAAQAQQRAVVPSATQSKVTTRKTEADYTPASPVRTNPASNKATSGKGYGKNSSWSSVGLTMFDRPTNASNYRRITSFPNGQISVNWTTAIDGSGNGYLSRGSGYTHFDGISWSPKTNERVEQFRTGYPNLDFDPINNREIILSHKVDTAGFSGGMVYNTNAAIGSSIWTSTIVLDTTPDHPGVLWPRTVVSGNYMTVIASYTDSSKNQPNRINMNGVRTPQVYSRLNLTSGVWEIKNQTLPDYDSTRVYQGGGDNYAIAANGNNVAILIGGLSDDISLWKSSDNGVNWTKTIIDSFPIPAFNYRQLIDTTFSTDGTLALTVDNTGNAHCFWALGRMLDTDTSNGNTSYSFFPGQNQIMYWYEGRPDSIVTAGFVPEDPNDADETYTIGSVIDDRVRYGNMSITSAPYVVRSGDTLYLAYQGRTDNDLDAQGIAFTDIYVAASTDNGATWRQPVNLTSAIGFNIEQTFPSIAEDCSTKLHLTFMNTNTQGFFDASTNSNKVGPFDIYYYQIPVTDLFKDTAILGTGLNTATNNLFTIGQNYPNPFNNSTIIPVSLTKKTDVKVTVMNILGDVVFTKTYDNTQTGANQLDINGAFKSGFYFYTVEAGEFKVSGKMLAQ